MSTPPQDPNQPQDPNRKPDDDGNQDQPEPPQYGQPQYGEHAPGYGQPRPGPSVAGQQPPMEHQNPTGQPYGSQNPDAQAPYGYQSAQPSAYGYPGQGGFQQPGPVSKPKEVEISFWLIIAAAVLTAISAIVALASFGSPAMMEQYEMMMNQQGTEMPFDADQFVTMITTVTVIISIIGIVLYLLLGFMVRKGKNWARITATVLAALSLLTLGMGVLQVIIVLVGIAAVVLLFLKPSSNYFNAVKAQKSGAYGQ